MRAGIAVLVLLVPLAWIHRRHVLNPGWHPVLVLSCLSVLTLAEVAGQLRLGAGTIVAGSLALLARELWIDRCNVLATVRTPSILAFFSTAGSLSILSRGQLVTHYDNFSH
jgi:hypothetical protein